MCPADIAICVQAGANGYNRLSSRILALLLASLLLQVRQELQSFGSVGIWDAGPRQEAVKDVLVIRYVLSQTHPISHQTLDNQGLEADAVTKSASHPAQCNPDCAAR